MRKKILKKQTKNLCENFKKTLISCNFSKSEVDILIKSNKLSEYLKNVLKNEAVFDEHFGPAIKEYQSVFDKHNIDAFVKYWTMQSEKKYQLTKVLFENFDKISSSGKLKIGEKYGIKIFPILKDVTNDDCIRFLKKQGAIFVGGEGLILLFNINEVWLPFYKHGTFILEGKRIESFIETKCVNKDNNIDIARVHYDCKNSCGISQEFVEFSKISRTRKSTLSTGSCLFCLYKL